MIVKNLLTFKQKKYIISLSKNETNQMKLEDYLLEHHYRGIEELSIQEASEVIGMLKEGQISVKYGVGTSSYLSDSIPMEVKLTISELHSIIFDELKPKIAEIDTITFRVGKEKQKEKRETIIQTPGHVKYFWVVKIGRYHDTGTMRFLLTIRPKVKEIAKFSKEELKQLIDSSNSLTNKIGDKFQIVAKTKIILFYRLKLDDGLINLDNWKVHLPDDTQVSYSEYLRNENLPRYLDLFQKHLPLNLKIINLTSINVSQISEVKNSLKEFGKVSDEILTTDYTRRIEPDNFKGEFQYVILSKDDQIYAESKEWFMEKGLVYQHIRFLEKFLHESATRTLLYFEMLAKTYPNFLFLNPSKGFLDEVSGFLYLNDTRTNKLVDGRYEKEYLLEVSYIFSDSHQDIGEKVVRFKKEQIPFFSRRSEIDFLDTEKLAKAITEEDFFSLDSKINIILSKRVTADNAIELAKAFNEFGVSLNKIYYISNQESRFVDGYAFGNDKLCQHPYKFLTAKAAIIKQATKLSIYPQLFSTLVELLFTKTNQGLNETDLAAILWLTKKRLYRYYQVYNLSLTEPQAVFNNSKDYLGRIKTDFFSLRHLI